MADHYIVPNPTGPASAVSIDPELCIGCNSCANICRIQTILPNPEKGRPPVVAYPDECWYCGCCVEACTTGALQMRLPANQRILFKDKESGEIFRIGTKDAPGKTFFKAPFGWIDHPELGKIMQFLEREDIQTDITLPEATGMKIGRFFGEKSGIDNTEKLKKFLKMVGFDNVYRTDTETDEIIITAESQDEVRLTIRQLSDLLHRLCVSSFSAVDTWRKL